MDLGRRADGQQPRFYLGTDRDAAQERKARLEQLWESILGSRADPIPMWDSDTLAFADAIRNGQAAYLVPPRTGYQETPTDYFERLQHLNRTYRGIAFLPEMPQFVEAGRQQKERSLKRFENIARQKAQELGVPAFPTTTVTLHAALDAYAAEVRRTFIEPGTDKTTAHGHVFARVIARLKDSHPDDLLDDAHFTYQVIAEMCNYWKRRPARKGTSKPISPDTVTASVKALSRFVRWVPKHYPWRKPEEWQDALKITKAQLLTKDEKAARGSSRQVKTYTLDELKIIYRYAPKYQRALMLLCLGCAFGAGELATLRLSEIHGDYIKRIRVKTGVWGEFWMWPETKDLVAWLRERHKEIGADTDLLVIRRTGQPLVRLTPNGNTSNSAANLWNALTERIRKDHPAFRRLSFNKLRKTGANIVRKLSDGETAGILLCHGKPVASDDQAEAYTDRPFHKVFAAQAKAREFLQPMFDQPTKPTPAERRGLIAELRSKGVAAKDIAHQLGVTVDTVYGVPKLTTSKKKTQTKTPGGQRRKARRK